MTTNEKRIKIAEACGWYKIYKGPEPDNRWMQPDGLHYATLDDVPDYFNDLNACHQMEKMLTHENWQTYSERLRTEVGFGCEDYRDANGTVVIELCGPQWHATAAQRAEAFGKTLNLW